MDPKDETQNPVSPTSSSAIVGNKETGRIAQVEELLKRSEEVPELESGVSEAGVEVHSEEPQLTQQVRDAGLKPSGEVQTPPLQPTGSVQLPTGAHEVDLNETAKGSKELSKTWRALKSFFAKIKNPLKDAISNT